MDCLFHAGFQVEECFRGHQSTGEDSKEDGCVVVSVAVDFQLLLEVGHVVLHVGHDSNGLDSVSLIIEIGQRMYIAKEMIK